MVENTSRSMLRINKIIVNVARDISNFCISSNYPIKAVSLLELVLKVSPGSKELHFMLATAQRAAGLRDASISTLRNTINLFPEDSVFLWTAGVWLLQYRRPAEALEYLVAYRDRWSDKYNKGGLANIHAVIGLCYLSLKRWGEAEEFLDRARRLAFWDLDACIGIVALYNYTGRLEKIPGVLNDYVQNNPALYPPYFWMGHHYQYLLRRPKESVEWYRKALERILDPGVRDYCATYVETLNMFDVLLDQYVDALIACGETNLVIKEIQKYENYNIGLPVEASRRLINLHVGLENFAEAEKFVKSIPRRLKDTPEILSAIANLEYKKGDSDKASGTIGQALLIDKESAQALDILGSIQLDKKMWKAAIETYRLLVNQFPFATGWLKSMGLCYLNMNQLDMARKYYEESVQYDELDADALVDLGNVYFKLGHNNLALSSFQNGLKYDWLQKSKRQMALRIIKQMES